LQAINDAARFDLAGVPLRRLCLSWVVRPTDRNFMNKVHAITGLSGRIDRVKSFIRDLSARAEFCLVLLIGFGPLIIVFQPPTALQSKHLELTTSGALGFPLLSW
jgi:hypothetical protein